MRTVSCSACDLAGLAAAVTRAGRAVRFCVRGNSMAPAIVAGERVWVAPVDARALTPGDIVLVGGPRPVLHRVVRIDPRAQLLVTRGDALADDDAVTDLGSVIGRVVRIDRSWLVRAKLLVRSCGQLLWPSHLHQLLVD